MALDVSSASPEPGRHLRSVSSQHAWQQPPLNSESCITMGGPPTPSSASGVMTNSSPSSATSMGQVAVSNHSGTHSESSLERPLRHGKRHSKRNSIHVTIPASPGSGSDSEEHANMNFSNINDSSPSPASFGQKHEQINVNFPSAPYKRLQHPADRNLCASFLGGIVFCLVSLIIGCPVVLFLFAVLPIFYVVRKLILWCCCCCKPGACSCCCADLMSDTELLWYHTSSHKPMVAQCLITLQHGLNIMRIEDLINSRLVSAENKNGSKQYPRFSQKVTSMPIGYAWIKDPEFSIHNHVFHIPETVENDEDLKEFVTELATKPLCLDHPLWEIHILTEFGKSRETVLLFRIHPCVTDGISLVHILFKGLVDNHSLCNLKPRFGSNTVCLNSLRGLLIGPLVFLQKWLCLRRDRNLLHGNHIHLSGKMAIAWSDAFSLPRAQRIKQVSRSSLNDVLMSVAAGCLRTYFQCHGVQNPYDIKTVIPVDLRTDSFRVTMGNKYTFVNVSLPTNTEGIVPRLWELKLRMDDIKSSADSTVLSSVCWLSNFLFSGDCFKQVWKTFFDKFTCFISNLPGPEQRLTFASKEIKNLVYWVPPRDRISVSICFMSYADEVRMSVLADRSVIPNPELLTREFILQMDMLSKLLANRRLPGEHISKRLEAMHIAQARMEEPTLEEIHVRMSDIQQHLQELKLRLDGASDNKRADDSTIIRQIEELKGEFRELMSELRLRRMSEGSSMLSDEEEEEDDEVMRRPFRRRTLSVSSRQSTSSVGSMCRPLTTSPAPHQPFPNSPPATTSSLACVNEEAHDVQRIEIHTYRSHHTVEMVTPAIRPGANGKPASDVR